MKAQINIFLHEDDHVSGIYDGTPEQFFALLGKAYKDCEGMKLAVLTLMVSVFENFGDHQSAEKCLDMIIGYVKES